MIIQHCPNRQLLSFTRLYSCVEGYTIDDVVYVWTTPGNAQSIVTASDMTLSQFDLIGWSHTNDSKRRYSGT